MHDPSERASLPPSFAPSSLAEIVVLSDLWSPIAEVRTTIGAAVRPTARRPRGADRRSGRGDLPLFRPHRIHRAGRRRRHHRRPRRELARRLPGRCWRATAPRSAPRPTGSAGASPSTAPTGRRANCCWRCTRAWAPMRNDAVEQPAGRTQAREAGMIAGLAARLRPAAGAARPARPAGAVVAAAAHSAAAAPHQFPADAAAVRHRAEGGDAGAHAVVADAAAAHARRAGHHRRRRAAVESAGRRHRAAARRCCS